MAARETVRDFANFLRQEIEVIAYAPGYDESYNSVNFEIDSDTVGSPSLSLTLPEAVVLRGVED